MALEMIKNNLMLPWAQAAIGFQAIKSPTKFTDGPFYGGNLTTDGHNFF